MATYVIGYSEHAQLEQLTPLWHAHDSDRWRNYLALYHGVSPGSGGSQDEPERPVLAWAGSEVIDWGNTLSVTVSGEEAYHAIGSELEDWITGSAGSDILEGRRGHDKLEGAGGNDRLAGGRGNDDLHGGSGVDTAVFSGDLDDFRFGPSSGVFQFKIIDERKDNIGGVDRIGQDIELLEFADVTIDLRETRLPEANDDRLRLNEDDKSKTLSVVENDVDLDVRIGLEQFQVTQVGSTAIGDGPTAVRLPSGAILTMWPDGRFVYNPNGKFDHLAKDKSANDKFNYTVTDGNGGTATATVRIVIKGTNDDPVAKNIRGAAGEAGPAITLTTDFDDVDRTDDHTFLIDTTGTKGSVVNNLDGTFSYSPNGKFESLAAGQTATDTFKYTVSDGQGGSATKTATVTITGANDAPLAQNVAGNVSEDGPAVVLTANFADVDTLDTHTFTINTTGTLGQVVNNNNGTFSYNPNAQFEALATGQTATDTFTYTVDDGHGGTSTKTVTVTILGVTD